MQIYGNRKKNGLHRKGVQLPQDLFGTPTWPAFHHWFGTPIIGCRFIIGLEHQYGRPFIVLEHQHGRPFIVLEHQHGRPFIVLEHQYGRRDVM